MRDLRLALVGTVTLALLCGLGGTVMAEAGEDGPTLTPVTGTQTSFTVVTPPVSETSDFMTYRGVQFERTIEWSDPRLPSLLLSNVNTNWHAVGEDDVGQFAQTHRLVGEDGDWVGTEYGFVGPESSLGLQVYTGEGAYEGLSAMLAGTDVVDADGNKNTIWNGYIFASELPPMPDPVELPAE